MTHIEEGPESMPESRLDSLSMFSIRILCTAGSMAELDMNRMHSPLA